MQNSENCHENVWILSGTSDGPVIVNKLIKTKLCSICKRCHYKASKSYLKIQSYTSLQEN